ncbi:MAG: SPOR domain-containing protein [Zoogloeaceae bacterium]|nr:SPOR domain-containing protein [Rhodocyclaceae bacterium]MCP5238169.1 SPOR domain-containing protein [Zoogloeaceae bacterium]
MKPDPTASVGSGDERRQAWIRIGAGASLILILLGVLAVLEPSPPAPADARPAGSDRQAAEARETDREAPATIVSTPREPLIGTAVALPGKPPELTEAAVAEAPTLAPEETAAPEIAPVEPVRDEASPPAGEATVLAAADEPVGGMPADSGDDGGHKVPPSSPAPAAPATGRLLLQLGVFGVESNATALLERVRKLGVPARLEARVVAGPFADRAALDLARSELRKAGLAETIVVRGR